MAFYREGLSNGLEGWGTVLRRVADPYLPDVNRLRKNDLRALYAAVARDRPDISRILPRMTMPCLLFAGEADALHPLIERCSRELPNGSFFWLPGLNHMQTIMRSDLVLPHVIRFLERSEERAGDRRQSSVFSSR